MYLSKYSINERNHIYNWFESNHLMNHLENLTINAIINKMYIFFSYLKYWNQYFKVKTIL